MLSIVIIEDDFASSEFLVSLLAKIDPGIKVKTVIKSVSEGIKYFQTFPVIDLVLSDIKLKDGLSFSIFDAVDISCPIIFISTYDKYFINAFKHNGIDYLLKPVSEQNIRQAIEKFQKLEKHFAGRNMSIKHFIDQFLQKKTRILVTKGSTITSILLSEVVFFSKENFAVFAFDIHGKKYLIDKSLNDLEDELDKAMFFRCNRQYIVNINYVQGYKRYERVKLLVTLVVKNEEIHVIISQEKAKYFKQWYAGMV